MANTKITDLGALTAAAGDEIPVNRAGADGKITVGDINALGATKALDNLASVAINTALLPASNDSAALGASGTAWSDLFLASGGVINWNAGTKTLTDTTDVEGSASLSLDFGSALGSFQVASSNAGVDGPGIVLYQNSATPAANDTPGFIDYVGKDSGGNVTVFATQNGRTLDPTNGSEDGQFIWRVQTGGVLRGVQLSGNTASFEPTLDDTFALGSTSFQFSDLFLASGGVIDWNASDLRLYHTPAGGGFGVGLKIDFGSSDNAPLQIYSSTGAGSGPSINWFSDSPSPANNDTIGQFYCVGNDSAANQTYYGGFYLVASDVTNGSEDAYWDFHGTHAGVFFDAVLRIGDGVALGGNALGGFPAMPGIGNLAFPSGGGLFLADDGVITWGTSGPAVLTGNGTTGFGALGGVFDYYVGGGNYAAVVVRSDGSGVGGPFIETFHQSSTPAANDDVGGWGIYGRNSGAGAYQNYCNLQGRILDPTSGSEDGAMILQAVVAGSLVDSMSVGDGVIIGSGTTFPGAGSVTLPKFVEFTEMTAPSAGAANTARLFVVDNGGGKSQLKMQFASGSAITIATEA